MSFRSPRSRRWSALINLSRLEDRLTPAIGFMGPHTPAETEILRTTAGAAWQPLLSAPTPSATQIVDHVTPGAWHFDLELDDVVKKLNSAPFEGQANFADTGFVLSIPRPDGTYQRFNVWEYSMMEGGLAEQFPDFHTYRGVGIDDPMATLAADVTALGFHAQVMSPTEGAYYIDPYFRNETETYVAYFRYQNHTPHAFYCLNNTDYDTFNPEAEAVGEKELFAGEDCGCDDHDHDEALSASTGGVASLTSSGGTLRTYRAAVAATGEYTAFHGGTVATGQAAIVTAVNRVNQIYESELAIRLILVSNNSSITYTNSATDPYTNGSGSTMLGQNQTTIDSVIGSGNYDIGHVFSTGGGGVAYLGCVGNASNKAGGVTGSSSPTGDSFWIDYVAHEMGHQFGGNHTFNSSAGSCGGGNRNSTTAYERGSGSTIMAYAGICSTDDLQPNSDPYFLWKSLDEISTFVNSGVGSGNTKTATGNNLPVVDAGTNYTIPANTPFALTGVATDVDGDTLTYLWEEADLGATTTITAADNGTSPLWRSWNPTTNPTRTFPRLSNLLANTVPTGEMMATTTRTLNMRLTVFDNRTTGAFVTDSMALSVVNTGAAFAVTAPNTAVSWQGGSTQTVTWNVAGTTGSGINAANVNILLSTDGGNTFPTTIASNVPNDGSESIVVPNLPTSSARIKVQPVGNVFFDLSNANFTITPGSSMSVTGISPTAGSTVTTPFTQVDVTFSAAVKASTIGTADLSLSSGTVTNAQLISAQVVRYTLAGLTAEGSVTVTVLGNAVTDNSDIGNNSFAAVYTLDYATTTFPTPLTQTGVAGTMAYTGTATGTVGAAGDSDAFTLNLDGGGIVSLLLTPEATLRGSVTIVGPGVNQTVSASTNGAPVVLQSIAVGAGGAFTLTVSGVASTTGTYSLRLDTNAATEAEGNGGTANDTTGTAQALATAQTFGAASVATARGRLESGNGSLTAETESNNTTGAANDATGDFAGPATSFYQMQINGSVSATSDSDYFSIGAMQVGDVLTFTASGTDGGRGTMSDPRLRLYAGASTTPLVDADDRSTGNLDALGFQYTVTTADTYYLRMSTFTGTTTGTYQIGVLVQNTGTAPTTGSGSYTEGAGNNGSTGTAEAAGSAWKQVNYTSQVTGTIGSGTDVDYFKYTFAAGDVVSATATSGGTANLALAFFNSAGTLLYDEKGVSDSLGNNSAMYGYAIATAGTYYVRVASVGSTTGAYTLNVNLATSATPPAPSSGQDVYSFAVTAGQPLSLGIEALTAGNVDVALLDNTGAVVQSGGAGATNFDETLSFTPGSSGTWYARVSGAANVDYQLTLTRGAAQDTEANDAFGAAQALVAGKAIGAIAGNDDWFSISATAGQVITLTTTTPGDAAGEFVNSLDPLIELYDPSNTFVGSDDNSAVDGRNAVLSKTAAATGNYRVRVRGAASTSGEYTLTGDVTTPANPPPTATIAVADGSGQRSMVQSLTVTFSEPVNIAAGAFSVDRLVTSTNPAPAGSVTLNVLPASGPATSFTITFNDATFAPLEGLAKSLIDGKYSVALNAGLITSAANGQQLDGDGNGTGGDNQSAAFHRLFGDTNGDGFTDNVDLIAFRAANGSDSTMVNYDPDLDFNADGFIDNLDFLAFRGRLGLTP